MKQILKFIYQEVLIFERVLAGVVTLGIISFILWNQIKEHLKPNLKNAKKDAIEILNDSAFDHLLLYLDEIIDVYPEKSMNVNRHPSNTILISDLSDADNTCFGCIKFDSGDNAIYFKRIDIEDVYIEKDFYMFDLKSYTNNSYYVGILVIKNKDVLDKWKKDEVWKKDEIWKLKPNYYLVCKKEEIDPN